jgi:hypothetical protein
VGGTPIAEMVAAPRYDAIDTALMSIRSASAQRTSRLLNMSFWAFSTTAGKVGSGWA